MIFFNKNFKMVEVNFLLHVIIGQIVDFVFYKPHDTVILSSEGGFSLDLRSADNELKVVTPEK